MWTKLFALKWGVKQCEDIWSGSLSRKLKQRLEEARELYFFCIT